MLKRFVLLYARVRNYLDYPLRQVIRWQRGGLHLPDQPKDHLYDHLPAFERQLALESARRLLAEYHLEWLYTHSTADIYRENLFYLALLEAALQSVPVELPDHLTVADIGPSAWFYVQSLYAVLCWRCCPSRRQVTLIGYERDAYRVYRDFRSRYDYATAYIANLDGVQYMPRAFEKNPATFDLITLLFPFIFLHDHLEWGLPTTLFNPTQLLADAWVSLKPGGVMLIVNQGETENRQQLELLRQVGIESSAAFLFESPLYRYDIPRYCIAALRRT